MKLARHSGAWISAPFLVTAVLAAFGNWWASSAAFLGFAFMIFFHRDPDRRPLGPGMVSPADGRVMVADSRRIAVFMNAFDVHVNRAPLGGTVKRVEYTRGGHAPAFLDLSVKNQQNLMEIKTDEGLLELCQISGILVRRIVSYVGPGDSVGRGQRIGMIRFGSRVEVTIPEDYEVLVRKGDRVRAGETIIAMKRS